MSAILPTEIQSNIDLYNLNESIKQKRARLDTAVSQLASGAYSAKKIFSKILEELETVINETIVQVEKVIVPEEDFQDFKDSNKTLDEFASFDMLKYYNGLHKLLFFLPGFHVALLELQDTPTKPGTPAFQSAGDTLDLLDTDEFDAQGSINPVFDDNPDFFYYTIVDSDTLQIIANKVFDGDTNRWPEIAQLNGLSDNDLIDGSLTGEIIKIPTNQDDNRSQSENNLVFEPFFDGTDQAAIDRFTYGRDLKINEKHFEISGTGDLRRVEGTDCYIQNIQSRFNGKKGTLSPSQEYWGIDNIEDYANVPPVIAIDRLLTDMEAQALDDGRTVSASALRRSLVKTGDRFDVSMEIVLIGGKSITENFSTSV